MNQTLMFNPPRMINEPMQPLPQTVCATLEHSGIPTSQPEMITDIPPELDWMAQLQMFQESFRFNTNNDPKDVLYSMFLPAHRRGGGAEGKLPQKDIIPWNYLPFMGSKWWTGQVSFKLIAIKPPKCAGRLLIRYSYFPEYDLSSDPSKKGPCIEWDLSLSSFIEFDVNGVCPMEARPTWLPEIQAADRPKNVNVVWGSQTLPYPSWSMGKITIEVSQRYVPGSIFPDSTRILVFMCYKNAKFFLPTDFRSDMATVLAKEFVSIKPTPT